MNPNDVTPGENGQATECGFCENGTALDGFWRGQACPYCRPDDDDDGGLVTFTEEEMAAMPKRRLVPFEGDFDVL